MPEGREAVSRVLVEAFRGGWKQLIVYRAHGDRFLGCGLGTKTDGVRLDVYGSSGDYLGSGLDGAQVFVHGDAQDQVGQILKSGMIVIFGSVGQTFLYGAKGGEAFVMGSAAGRPLINAVGQIRAVINGTCLDYCAESFMAGESLGGGFVIINGLAFDERGQVIGLDMKYPGNNLFSLASGGACYLNDPYGTVERNAAQRRELRALQTGRLEHHPPLPREKREPLRHLDPARPPDGRRRPQVAERGFPEDRGQRRNAQARLVLPAGLKTA